MSPKPEKKQNRSTRGLKQYYSLQHDFRSEVDQLVRLLGQLEALHQQPLALRRHNRILSIQASLSIEGNSLDIKSVTDVIDGKKIQAPPRDVLEVQNANQLYQQMRKFNPLKVTDFLKAHKILMHKLVTHPGRFRSSQVGVFQGAHLVHQAPSFRFVPELVAQLFSYLKTSRHLHPIVASCLGHYEIEFIHPFTDGNGRMGRFWQSVLLARYDKAFYFLPIEPMIKKNQKAYYAALRSSDRQGHATAFVKYMLGILEKSLRKMLLSTPRKDFRSDRLSRLKRHIKGKKFSRKDYMAVAGSLSTATASRDLQHWVKQKKLKRYGSGNATCYQF